jgi:hypothetical protein
MQEECEAIDKIIKKVIYRDDYASKCWDVYGIYYSIAKEALNEGFLAGHEVGYDQGYSVGFCEGAGTDA